MGITKLCNPQMFLWFTFPDRKDKMKIYKYIICFSGNEGYGKWNGKNGFGLRYYGSYLKRLRSCYRVPETCELFCIAARAM